MFQRVSTRARSILKAIVLLTMSVVLIFACKPRNLQKDEQITITRDRMEPNKDSIFNYIQGNASFSQISTHPNSVILTGLAGHRLITIYKTKTVDKSSAENSWSYSRSSDYVGNESGMEKHFMPGIDILYGYNLLNIAHYDLPTGKVNFLFQQPVLIKILYYPSFEPDSLHKKPIQRNYYLVSVYDQDTNKDSLINRKDLRRFYYFDVNGNGKIQLIPSDYSVIRSQYDSQNDLMYIFAKQDTNKNGTGDKDEPVHIFQIDLKLPTKAIRFY
jgi:hypothetical protein